MPSPTGGHSTQSPSDRCGLVWTAVRIGCVHCLLVEPKNCAENREFSLSRRPPSEACSNRPCEIQTAAASRNAVIGGERTEVGLTVARAAFGAAGSALAGRLHTRPERRQGEKKAPPGRGGGWPGAANRCWAYLMRSWRCRPVGGSKPSRPIPRPRPRKCSSKGVPVLNARLSVHSHFVRSLKENNLGTDGRGIKSPRPVVYFR